MVRNVSSLNSLSVMKENNGIVIDERRMNSPAMMIHPSMNMRKVTGPQAFNPVQRQNNQNTPIPSRFGPVVQNNLRYMPSQ